MYNEIYVTCEPDGQGSFDQREVIVSAAYLTSILVL